MLVKSMASGTMMAEFKSWICHLAAVQLWAIVLPSLNFFFSKMCLIIMLLSRLTKLTHMKHSEHTMYTKC